MKKLLSVMAVAMLVGAVSSLAQGNSNETVLAAIDITMSGSLQDTSKTKVTEADLLSGSALTGKVVLAAVQVADTNSTTNVVFVIGSKSLSALSTNISGTTTTLVQLVVDTAVLMRETSSQDLGKGKFEAALLPTDANSKSGAVWIVNGTLKADSKGTNVSAKVVGMWDDGTAIKSLSIKTAK